MGVTMKRLILLALFPIIFINLGCTDYQLTCEPDVAQLTEQAGRLTYYFPPREAFGTLSDGTYLGRILCGSDLGKVTVVVKDNAITECKINYLLIPVTDRDVLKTGPERFLKEQSPQFDAITGATASTHLLKICFTRALWQAAGKEDPMEECVPMPCK